MNRAVSSLSVLAATGALVAAGLGAVPGASAAPPPARRAVARTAPTWVAGARSLGDAPATGVSTFQVHLSPRGGTAALEAQAARVSDPASPTYRHFLSARQYHRRYDATSTAVRAVSRFLGRHGLAVTSVEAHHRYLSVRGTNAAVEKAFHVAIKTYLRHGRRVQANTSAVTLPRSLAPYVSTVLGLDTTPHLMKRAALPPPEPGIRNARPCSTYYGQLSAARRANYKGRLPRFKGRRLSYAPCGYTGPQLRPAYEGQNAAKLDGTGVTVAVTDAYASPNIAADANRYAVRHGDGGYARGQLTQSLPASYNKLKTCDASGWYGEETLDVEAVHAMAPRAGIRYYGAKNCLDAGFLPTLTRVVDEDRASLVTNSWGDVETNVGAASVAAYHQIFLQGALQGISFLFSSGDDGDEVASTGIRQTEYPVSDPVVTAVGGTADAIGANGSFLFQTGWGTHNWSLTEDGTSWAGDEGFFYGAGGGSSTLFNRPGYQNGVVPRSFGPGRAVPDIGMDADPNTGFLVGETQTFPDGVYYDEYRVGGTSVASPLFAGMTALLLQHAGGRLGALDPAIYAQAGKAGFSDIKGSPPDAGVVRVNFDNGLDETGGLSYFVRTFDQDSSLVTVKGWDDVTGIGSPTPSWVTSIER